jgi:valyl-tRNA synthetase
VKGRRYGDQGAEASGSANAALSTALSVLLRLLAPFLPFVTEEVWSWWQPGSIHQSTWPTAAEIENALTASDGASATDQAVYRWATEVVLFEVRKRRSEDKQPLKVPITKVTIKADPASLSHMSELEADLKSALRVQAFEYTPVALGSPTEIVVTGYEPLAT